MINCYFVAQNSPTTLKSMPCISSLHFSFSGHCSCHALPQRTGKSLVCDILSFESMILRPLSPLGLFCGQMKDKSKVFFFFFSSSGLTSFVSMMQSFHLKSSVLKNADTKTRCCILILIPLQLQWVKGGRNLPNVLIKPPPASKS